MDESRGATRNSPSGVLAFALAALFALSLLRSPGTGDMNAWLSWADAGSRLGLRAGYAASADVYPPLTIAVLTLAVKAGAALGWDATLAIKTTLWLFLVATGVVFARWTRSAALGALVLGSLTLGAMGLAYTDVLLAPSLLASLRALQEGRTAKFAVHFSIAALFKWQPVIVGPILLVHLIGIRRLRDWRGIPFRRLALSAALPAAAVFATAAGVVGVEVFRSLLRTRILDPLLSGNALNANWIFTWLLRASGALGTPGLESGKVKYLVTDDLRLTLVPDLVFAALYVLVCRATLRDARSFDSLMRRCLAGFLCYFCFATRVHENHLFVAVLLAAALLASDARAWLASFGFWAAAYNVNMLLFYGATGKPFDFSRVVGIDLTVVLAALLLAAFWTHWRSALRPPPDGGAATEPRAAAEAA